ncbi:hypothetical protein JST97_13625 [bacterium]|nr:hypothetical protein [bacterium]
MDSLNRIHSNFNTRSLPQLNNRVQTEGPSQALVDRFQASTDGAPAPQYKDMLKLVHNSADTKKASPDVVYASLHGKDTAGAEKALAGMQPAERLQALESLRKNHKQEYKALLDGIHSGQVKDQQVALGMSLDQLAGTKWAGQNKEEMKLLKQKYADKQIQFGTTEGGEAITRPGQADGQGNRPSTITLDPKWTSSPEGMAATLAHEGQHALHYATNNLRLDLAEEVDAHTKEAAVWNEFGSSKYDSKMVDKKNNPWDETARHYDPKDHRKMMNHVAYEYASGYNKLGQDERAKAILDQYFDAATFDPKLLQSASRDELAGLDRVVVNQLGKSKSADEQEVLRGFHGRASAILDGPAK